MTNSRKSLAGVSTLLVMALAIPHSPHAQTQEETETIPDPPVASDGQNGRVVA